MGMAEVISRHAAACLCTRRRRRPQRHAGCLRTNTWAVPCPVHRTAQHGSNWRCLPPAQTPPTHRLRNSGRKWRLTAPRAASLATAMLTGSRPASGVFGRLDSAAAASRRKALPRLDVRMTTWGGRQGRPGVRGIQLGRPCRGELLGSHGRGECQVWNSALPSTRGPACLHRTVFAKLTTRPLLSVTRPSSRIWGMAGGSGGFGGGHRLSRYACPRAHAPAAGAQVWRGHGSAHVQAWGPASYGVSAALWCQLPWDPPHRQQDVEHLWVGLLNLIKQHHAVWLAPHLGRAGGGVGG